MVWIEVPKPVKASFQNKDHKMNFFKMMAPDFNFKQVSINNISCHYVNTYGTIYDRNLQIILCRFPGAGRKGYIDMIGLQNAAAHIDLSSFTVRNSF